MRKFSMRLAFAGFGIVISSLSATSQSQGPQNPSCPAGYWLLGTLCLNNEGDVVKAVLAAPRPVANEPGCAPGYWRLNSLCLSSETGDVERVDEARWPADQRPEARN